MATFPLLFTWLVVIVFTGLMIGFFYFVGKNLYEHLSDKKRLREFLTQEFPILVIMIGLAFLFHYWWSLQGS